MEVEHLLIIHTTACCLLLIAKLLNNEINLSMISTIILILVGYLMIAYSYYSPNIIVNKTINSISTSSKPFAIGVTNVTISKDKNGNQVTKYKLSIKYKKDKFFVWRRYSEYLKFHNECLKKRNLARNKQISFPNKSSISQYMFSNDTTLKFVEQRKDDLHNYIRKSIPNLDTFEDLAITSIGKEFLAIPKSVTITGKFNVDEANKAIVKEATDALKESIDIAQFAIDGGGDDWNLYKTSHDKIKCFLKKQNGFTFAMGIGDVEATPIQLLKLLSDVANRSKWDELFKKDTLISQATKFEFEEYKEGITNDQELPNCFEDDDNYKLITSTYKWTEFSSPASAIVGERDSVCAYCTAKRISDGAYIIALKSFDSDPRAPEIGTAGYIRANVMVASFLLIPVKDGSKNNTTVITFGCVNPNGAIPDFIVSTVAPQRAFLIRDLNKLALNY